MGWVLAFDTAQPHCAGALAREDHHGDRVAIRVVATEVEPMAQGQAERLLPMLEGMLAAAGIGWRDLDAIGVGTGPGNFTGTRIAVAAARGLALGLGVPAVGVSYFEAMALRRRHPCWALVPGPLGQTYARRASLADEEAVTLDAEAVSRLEGDRVWLGDVPAETVLGDMAEIAIRLSSLPGQPRPAPLYLRPPDAAPARGAAPAVVPG